MALIKRSLKTEINSSTYVAITPTAENVGNNAAIWTADGQGFIYAFDSSGTGATIVPAPGAITIGDIVTDGTPIFYAKSVSSTIDLNVQAVKA